MNIETKYEIGQDVVIKVGVPKGTNGKICGIQYTMGPDGPDTDKIVTTERYFVKVDGDKCCKIIDSKYIKAKD